MESLIFALNATVPIFIMMVLGYALNRIGWMDREFAGKLNTFVFRLPLPMLLFSQIAELDIRECWDGFFVFFCAAVTVVSIVAAALLSRFVKDRSVRGEMVQASYRSSAALLGIALINNLYGTSLMAPLMVVAAVPLYNMFAVIVLTFLRPGTEGKNRLSGAVMKKTLKGIATNPIIIGCLIGVLWSLLRVPMPAILHKSVSSVGSLSTPLGLMSMGASVDLKKISGHIGPMAAAVFLKLIGFCAVFLPVAVAVGFRMEKLIAITVMLGSATTISAYVMARNMGHEGSLTAGAIMLTTLISSFTLTGWIWILRALALV